MAGALVSHLIQFMIKHPEAAACFVLGIFTGIILLILYSYEVRHFIGISISFIVGDKQLAARLEDYDEMIIPFLIKAKDHLARAGPARPGQRMITAGSATTADADRADGNV